MKSHKVNLEFKEVESCIQCGLRINWLEGNAGKDKISLDCGAGVGTPWLIFTKEVGGVQKTLVCDIRDIIPKLSKILN